MAALTLTALSLILAGTSTATQIIGQKKAGDAAKKAGKQQKEAANSQAELQDWNAHIADLQADDAVERGAEEEQRYRSTIRGTIGTQRANIAAGNIDVAFGSAVDVQADAAMIGELDALTIRSNARRQQWGFQVEATDLRKRAAITRKEGVYLEKAGNQQAQANYLNAGASLLGGGASLLSMKYGFDRQKNG